MQAVRKSEGILYGQAHVGHAQLGFHGTVGKLHRAVHHALRMDEHLYAVGRDAEEPLGLDHLKAFVHHRCAVDGDFGPHLPGRMAQRVGAGHLLQLFVRYVSERAARCREQQFFHRVVALAHQALEYGRVLAVNRDDGCTVLRREFIDQLSSHHQCLFVGQTDFLARLDGLDGRCQTGKSHHGRQHHVDGFSLHHVADGPASGIHLDERLVGQQLFQCLIFLFVGNDHGRGLHFARLFGQQFHLVVGGEAIHLKAVGMLPHHVDGLSAYRTRRA